ncbi:MAG: hypothetical protein OXH06_04390 [Gemmatimonadetes bacterium]|nr:hypothetical protein [Gemmatimonadota bacterium]MDE3258384.1 hypothetical protein [Gemmatimonadota bacterium]
MTDAVRRRGRVTLRQGLLLIFVLGSIGLGVELLLLGHFQEWRQQVPLVLLVSGLVLVTMNLVCRRPVVLRIFRLAMLAYVLGGIVGFWFHINGNMEFELEMNSRLTGWDLVSRTAGGALPVLAPGALVQLGLIGVLYTYRHPGLDAGQREMD